MTREEVLDRLRKENRSAISRATGIRRGYLDDLVYRRIKNPGSEQIDQLRSHFVTLDIARRSH